ncbi:MAG: von Willebrand factor type A domain-containing protein [Bacteroidales bacterium]|nr:von Willebrand factor type A domain-containing protein [Bacteroidales bacterium]
MKRFLTLIMLMSLISQAFASFTVSGTVTDEANQPLTGVTVVVTGTQNGTITDIDGKYTLTIENGSHTLKFAYIGYEPQSVNVSGKDGDNLTRDVQMEPDPKALEEVVVIGYGVMRKMDVAPVVRSSHRRKAEPAPIQLNTEKYDSREENEFKNTSSDPISVFSVDVDKAGYSNIRRFINNSQKPPKGSVRVEEIINYFEYDYPQPKGADPVSLNAEISDCPWKADHQLIKIGLKAKEIDTRELPASHIVFLIDVSGSMYDDNKLPLLIRSFKFMTNNLRPQDKVSIITYASGTDIKLTAEPCNEKGKEKIVAELEKLQASGYTAGGEAIQKAYRIAKENFIKGGNNRIILATDGDFNVGQSSDGELKQMVKEGAKEGVFLTVLGYGMYNLNDRMMETIADNGNGNYAYIDNISEAQKALGTELWGTLYTVAKDVKVLVDFNPAKVKAYRLVGYENRLLNNEDFNNDKKDAGDMGSGHSVTALYEIVPAKSKESTPSTVQSEYVTQQTTGSDNFCTIKFRYKHPDKDESLLVERRIGKDSYTKTPSTDFKIACSGAMFGMLLNDSKFIKGTNYKSLLEYLKNIPSDDKGYIDELKVLVRKASEL